MSADIPANRDLVHRVVVLTTALTTHRAQPAETVADKRIFLMKMIVIFVITAVTLQPDRLTVCVTGELRILPDNLIAPRHEIHVFVLLFLLSRLSPGSDVEP